MFGGNMLRRCSLLFAVMIVGLISIHWVQAAAQATGRYSCGVDNPTATQCKRTVSQSPIDCVQSINTTTGAVSYGCKIREPQRKTLLQLSDVITTKLEAVDPVDTVDSR